MTSRKSLAGALALTLALAGSAAAQSDTSGYNPNRTSNEVTTPTNTQTGTTGGAYDNTNTTDNGSLPATASPLPTVGLVGASAIIIGVWLNRRRNP